MVPAHSMRRVVRRHDRVDLGCLASGVTRHALLATEPLAGHDLGAVGLREPAWPRGHLIDERPDPLGRRLDPSAADELDHVVTSVRARVGTWWNSAGSATPGSTRIRAA